MDNNLTNITLSLDYFRGSFHIGLSVAPEIPVLLIIYGISVLLLLTVFLGLRCGYAAESIGKILICFISLLTFHIALLITGKRD